MISSRKLLFMHAKGLASRLRFSIQIMHTDCTITYNVDVVMIVLELNSEFQSLSSVNCAASNMQLTLQRATV